MESKGDLVIAVSGVTDEQAKAVQSLATFGTTVVSESSQLAQYAGRVLGTIPHDAVGLVLGDPLRFVRTAIAGQYDFLLTKIFKRRNVANAQAVSPSLAIPLLRAAYDESRPELQELWAGLIASAMDPKMSGRVRLSFIDTLRRFDPLDAVVLRERINQQSARQLQPTAIAFIVEKLGQAVNEVEISVDNLHVLNCVASTPPYKVNFFVTNYGRALIQACTE